MNNTNESAISVTSVSKTFRLPHEKSNSIKSLFVNPFKKRRYDQQKVLKNINFEIKKGEFFGIVGRNGSGKSTLLKLLAGIYSPDSGHIQINGKLTPFIELGVGFNPELTGRENVYLNGALLGFNRKEMLAMYDEIVDFAELRKFMDQKLKNYSSGMQVRLAFSIAIRANSEILVLDEVLAVGDEAFQRKCINVFEKYKASNKTIVLVTHDMSVVEKYCSRAILLSDGDIVLEGDPRKVARQYSVMNEDSYIYSKSKEEEISSKRKELEKIGLKYQLIDSKGKKLTKVSSGEKITLNINWKDNRIKNIGVALLRESGEYVYGTNTIIDKKKIKDKHVTYNLDANLGSGNYKFVIGLFGNDEADAIDFIDGAATFFVSQGDEEWGGVTKLDHKWS